MMNSVFTMELPIPRYQWPAQNLAISWSIFAGALRNSALKNTAGGLRRIGEDLLIREKGESGAGSGPFIKNQK